MSASLALVNDDVAITEVSHQLVEASALVRDLGQLDPTVPTPKPSRRADAAARAVRRADDQLARRGETTIVDIAWAGGRIGPSPCASGRAADAAHVGRVGAGPSLRPCAARHDVPQLRDAVVQAIESIDMDAVAVAVDAPAAQMVSAMSSRWLPGAPRRRDFRQPEQDREAGPPRWRWRGVHAAPRGREELYAPKSAGARSRCAAFLQGAQGRY